MDLEWSEGKLVSAKILSKNGTDCKIRLEDKIIEVETEKGKEYTFNSMLEIQ